MNKDQVKGGAKEVKGKIKEIAGKVVGNKSLEQKGRAEKLTGEIQRGFGNAKEDVKKSI